MRSTSYKVITGCDILLHNTCIIYHSQAQKYNLQYDYKMLTSWRKVPRARKESLAQKKPRLVSLLWKESLIFYGRLHFDPSPGTWTYKFKGVRTSQQLIRLPPSGIRDKSRRVDTVLWIISQHVKEAQLVIDGKALYKLKLQPRETSTSRE